MTLQELYLEIGGDYDQAMKVLRMDKLLDKHIRRFTQNGVIDGLIAAENTMDPAQLFDSAHAMKGVCANLGLTALSSAASELAEEFRPGNPRKLSDDEVKSHIDTIHEMYDRTTEGIQKYVDSNS